MNPLAALIGGGASILGSLLNTSSQQSINTQNLQAAEYINQGMNLPRYYQNLVSGANQAGLNPLAVLGSRGPDAGFSAGGAMPGAGLEALGRGITAVDPRDDELKDRQIAQAKADYANTIQAGSNAAIQGAVNSWILDRLHREPGLLPPGYSQPSVIGTGSEAVQKLFGIGPFPGPSSSAGSPIDVLTRGFGAPGWSGGMPSWLGGY